MDGGVYLFGEFVLDPGERRLTRGGAAVELNARYLDALALLVREAGKLVSKDRFLDEVWRGVPVTDEALTQCIKTLRRALGDDAASPRFIETVPKHGYRFVADIVDGAEATEEVASRAPWRRILLFGGAGTIGAGVAGAIGGLCYGFAATAQPGAGAASVLLVLLWLTVAAALMGGAGVSLGIAVARRGPAWSIAGGALGGLVVGGAVKLLGLDAFNLLFGRAPDGITGAAEGALLGGAAGLGVWLAGRTASFRRGIALAALAGAAGGLAIALLGGRLMGGSLALLADAFPGSRLSLDALGTLFGESGFGPVASAVTATLEGALFAACIAGAMRLARQGTGVISGRPFSTT